MSLSLYARTHARARKFNISAFSAGLCPMRLESTEEMMCCLSHHGSCIIGGASASRHLPLSRLSSHCVVSAADSNFYLSSASLWHFGAALCKIPAWSHVEINYTGLKLLLLLPPTPPPSPPPPPPAPPPTPPSTPPLSRQMKLYLGATGFPQWRIGGNADDVVTLTVFSLDINEFECEEKKKGSCFDVNMMIILPLVISLIVV